MARPGPQTHAKRMRERAKQEKRKAKEEKKARRKAEKLAALNPEAASEASSEVPVPPETDQS